MGGKTVREERLYNHMIKILGLGPPLIHLHQQQFITEYLNLSVLSTQYSVFLQTDRKIIHHKKAVDAIILTTDFNPGHFFTTDWNSS